MIESLLPFLLYLCYFNEKKNKKNKRMAKPSRVCLQKEMAEWAMGNPICNLQLAVVDMIAVHLLPYPTILTHYCTLLNDCVYILNVPLCFFSSFF